MDGRANVYGPEKIKSSIIPGKAVAAGIPIQSSAAREW